MLYVASPNACIPTLGAFGNSRNPDTPCTPRNLPTTISSTQKTQQLVTALYAICFVTIKQVQSPVFIYVVRCLRPLAHRNDRYTTRPLHGAATAVYTTITTTAVGVNSPKGKSVTRHFDRPRTFSETTFSKLNCRRHLDFSKEQLLATDLIDVF